MLGRLYQNQDCSAARALELVGERWSLLILRDAMFRGSTRFSQFEKSLGIAPNILTRRLEDFVVAGILERRAGPGDQPEYTLTAKGLDFKPTIMALTAWGDKWVRPGPVDFRDAAGEPVSVELRRAEDGAPVGVADIVARRR